MFTDFLREHRNGASHNDLSEALQALVAAVAAEGKSGTLTYTIAVKPTDKGEALIVTDAIKVTAPKSSRAGSIFYADADNNLVREDPRQSRLELRSIPEVPRKEA